MTADSTLQYVVSAVVTTASVGAWSFAWRANAEAVRIRTILCEPKIGMVDRVDALESRIERCERDIGQLPRRKADET